MHFLLGAMVNFLGHVLTFRRNRSKQIMLLQMCVFMGFFIGNVYQSMLTTFMTESRVGKRFNTLKELLESDHTFKVDPTVYDYLKDIKQFEMTGKIEKIELGSSIVRDIAIYTEKKVVFLVRCDMADILMSEQGPKAVLNDYYILHEKFMKSLTSFELSDDSPYRGIFQHYSNLVFESGIKQHWKIFYENYEDTQADIKRRYFSEEKYLLKFDDLKGVFIVWIFCLVMCGIVLVFEICFHDCIKNVSCRLAKKICCTSKTKTKKKKPKKKKYQVRFVQVEPINIGESVV